MPTPRHLQASESDAAAAAISVLALCCPSSPSADLPSSHSGDSFDKSDVAGHEQPSRDADRADGLTPTSQDASTHAVSHPPPLPDLRVVPALELTKQDESAAAAQALAAFSPTRIVITKLRLTCTRTSCRYTGEVTCRSLQLATIISRARPNKQ